MARIYTKTGDTGETSLADGTRTSKANARVDLYGDVDELNSQLGLCVARMRMSAHPEQALGAPLADLAAELEVVQHRLFDLGALLADPARCARSLAALDTAALFSVADLEASIDRLTAELPALTQFILPGGSETGALVHIARAVCRRVERKTVALAADEPVPPAVVTFLNRLSDYLFMLARGCNAVNGCGDVTWRPAGKS